MKIVTWNVNSLKARVPYVEWYLDRAAPDVLCLQELKLEADAVPREIFESRGYELAIHGQRQWNGVAIASRLPIEDVTAGLPDADEGEARLVAGTIAGLRIVNVYCPQGQAVASPKFAYKLRFYAALRDLLAGILRADPDLPLVLCGDMNVAPNEHDVWDPEAWRDIPTFHPLEHAEWAELVALGLSDAVMPHIEPGTYSFWDYRGGAFFRDHGVRIDHLLVTAPVMERVLHAFVDREVRKKRQDWKASDHAPVGIVLGDEAGTRGGS